MNTYVLDPQDVISLPTVMIRFYQQITRLKIDFLGEDNMTGDGCLTRTDRVSTTGTNFWAKIIDKFRLNLQGTRKPRTLLLLIGLS